MTSTPECEYLPLYPASDWQTRIALSKETVSSFLKKQKPEVTVQHTAIGTQP